MTFKGKDQEVQSLFSRAFTRLLAPAYDDGLMSPRARSVVGNGKTLPSPRLVSVNIHNDVSAPHVRYSLMMMQWGQVRRTN